MRVALRQRQFAAWRSGLIAGLVAIAMVACRFVIPPEAVRPWTNSLSYAAFAWAAGFVATLFVYMAVSVDDTGDVIAAALYSSSATVWLVPVALLLATRDPWPMCLGLIVLANTVRLLAGSRAPAARGRVIGPVERTDRVTGSVFAATLIYGAAFSIWGGVPLLAAVLVAGATVVWTRRAIRRGAYVRESAPGRMRAVANFALAVIAATLIAAAPSMRVEGVPAVEQAGIFEDSTAILQRLVRAPQAKRSAASPLNAPRVIQMAPPPIGTTTKGGIPGIVLREQEERPQRISAPVRTERAKLMFSLHEPVSFPFTGEYRLYRTSSKRLPAGSKVEVGTPLDAVFVTTDGGPMQTEAYQGIEPPIHLKECAGVQMLISSREALPAAAHMELITSDGARIVGSEIFGMMSSSEETLVFSVPSMTRDALVSGIRVIFSHNPTEAYKSAKVKIERFTLTPRYR